jgi:hypothetical protein
MKLETKQIHKETLTQVCTGIVINYPLNLLMLYTFIELWQILDPVTISIMSTIGFTLIAYVRIFLLRTYFSKKYK